MAAKNSRGLNSLTNNKLIFGGIAVLVVLVFVGTLTFLQSIYQTSTYYVINQDVATRTLITPDMLTAIVTSDGTEPPTSFGIAEIQSGAYYSKYPLVAGDILTSSNVGALDDISVGVPDNWVITNFSVDADDAVGGRIKRGYYFDMLVTTTEGSFYPFVNVLVLDTSVDLNNASSNNAADTSEAKSGQTSQYVVGMSPENAALLQDIVSRYGNSIKLVLSPRQNEYNKPQLASYAGLFSYNIYENGVIWPGESNSGEITNYTFQDIERDKYGRPINGLYGCIDKAGNNHFNWSATTECEGTNPSKDTDTDIDTTPTTKPTVEATIKPTTEATVEPTVESSVTPTPQP